MPLRSLRTRLVALFLVSLAIAAFLFAAVAVRQFTQEERSRARSELSRQATQTVRLIEEFAEKRLSGEAGAPPTSPAAWGHHGGARVLRRAIRAGAADRRGALRQGAEGTETARLEAAGDEGQGADARPEARRRHGTLASPAGFRYGGRADRRDRRRRGRCAPSTPRRSCRAGASCLRCCSPLLRPRSCPAAQPAHYAPGARADRGERAHRAGRLRRPSQPRRAPTSSASSRCGSSRWPVSSSRRASTSATS